MMRLTADYHTHTNYSDAHATILQNAARAKELSLQEIAITDHGFTHHILGIRKKERAQYIREVKEAREKIGINVLVGIEANILGSEGKCDLEEGDFDDFDVYLAGFHIASKHETRKDLFTAIKGYFSYNFHRKPSESLIKSFTRSYLNAVERNPIDILTHVNFQCFADSVEVAKCCRDYGTYIEISGKKTHFSDDELYSISKTGVHFVVNSDAHSPERIGDVAIALEQIERVGISHDQIDNVDGKLPKFRFREFKQRG